MIEHYWLLYGHVHDQGRWPPLETTGPYPDRDAAVAAYDGSGGLPAAIAVTATDQLPTGPDAIMGLDGHIDSQGGT